jgi:tetratricopeptide (TPR) repeat protein
MALFEQGLALNRALGSKGGTAWSLELLGMIAWVMGDYPRATVHNEESLALYRELGDRRGMASVLHQLGDVAREQGDYARATELFAESRGLYLELNDSWGIAAGFLGMGDVLLNQGNATRAALSFEQAVDMYRVIGDKGQWATALRCLGRAAHVQGDDERAFALYMESLVSFREQQKVQGVAGCLVNIASVWGARGRPIRAARLLGAAQTLFGPRFVPSVGITGLLVDEERDVANVRAQLDEATFAAAWAEGQALTLEQAIAEALDDETPASW